ncbi:nuclear pore complex protein Nup98-Nup96-like [Hetaerina americana]|uniref:nuclear pore complex protein Nup98-Nup96-like n=1 Tax=Hetaerina americana TaxID=62018 RepID=UPI003A7F4EFE
MVSGTSWKFLPTLRTEHMRWKGARRKIHASYQCITFMLEYQSKSLEELRHEDYAMGRVSSSAKGRSPTSEVTHGFGTMAGVFGTAGSFFSTPARAIAPAGGFSSAMGVFANSGFTYTVPGSNSFGTPNGIGSFGATPWPSTPFQDGFTMNSFRFSAFGEKNQNTGLFGQYKNPFSATGIFGAVSTQSANVSGTFGASTTVPNTFRLPPDFGLSPSANSPVISSAFGFMKAFTFGSTSQANAGLVRDFADEVGISVGSTDSIQNEDWGTC